MTRRFVSIWFRSLLADWTVRRHPERKELAFVLAAPERGRMVIKSVSAAAQKAGVAVGMVVADCRAILPTLQVFDYTEGEEEKLLHALAEWCIRFTPVAAIDLPDGLILDASGCTHLWNSEQAYCKDITFRLKAFGYDVRIGMADTIGAAWAVARFGNGVCIIERGTQMEVLLPLHPSALRLETSIVARLEKLGLRQIGSFITMPRRTLRRRFGDSLLMRIDQALGHEREVIQPVTPIEPYQERLPCLEPIRTATGIEIAIKQLLEMLCRRLEREGKGLRKAIFKGYRIDGITQQITIGTNRASRNVQHLYKLLEIKIVQLEPALGFELFVLEAPVVEDIAIEQAEFWNCSSHDADAIAELLDRIAGKVGAPAIHRYLPAEHYWPERSITAAASLQEQPGTAWVTHLPRPIHLLHKPELIEVTVQMPDYPPMLFIYKGTLHRIKKADGPERIEQEWWLEQGLYRDYYCVEDEQGLRYWLFRLGDYRTDEPKWYLHGFFA